MKIYRLYIKTTIEYEYINEDIEFFLSEENIQQFKKEFIKQHSRPDGSWIPNINYIDFEEDEITFEEAKFDMSVAQFEELFNVNIDKYLRKVWVKMKKKIFYELIKFFLIIFFIVIGAAHIIGGVIIKDIGYVIIGILYFVMTFVLDSYFSEN